LAEAFEDEGQGASWQPSEVVSRSVSGHGLSGLPEESAATSQSADDDEGNNAQSNKTAKNSIAHAEGHETHEELESEHLREDHGTSKPVEEGEDFIDYFEDEEEELAGSGRSSTVHGDPSPTVLGDNQQQRLSDQHEFGLTNGIDHILGNDETNHELLESDTLKQNPADLSFKPDVSRTAQPSVNEDSPAAQNGETAVEAGAGHGEELSNSANHISEGFSQQQSSLSTADENFMNPLAGSADMETVGVDPTTLYDQDAEDDLNDFDGIDEWHGDDTLGSTAVAGDTTYLNLNDVTEGKNGAEEEDDDEFDATITWDEENEVSLPQKKPESPLGKRNFDEHAEGLSEGEFDQGKCKRSSAVGIILSY
jgi:hypothetical protein